MVRALLAGTKTQTRRVIKPQHLAFFNQEAAALLSDWSERPLPYGKTGDRLWVREAWCACRDLNRVPPRDIPPGSSIEHEATKRSYAEIGLTGKLRPSMFMPRWASRITLEITSVRVERLQEISIEDAKAEGAWGPDDSIVQKVADYFGTDIFSANPRKAFQMLWESINGPDSWAANPWVWAIEFRRVP